MRSSEDAEPPLPPPVEGRGIRLLWGLVTAACIVLYVMATLMEWPLWIRYIVNYLGLGALAIFALHPLLATAADDEARDAEGPEADDESERRDESRPMDDGEERR